ncbi:hypothetical protein FHT12_000529 [Xanthomonas campestris]|uniref:DUF1833 family protein n=1 Tax=Xanthomonas euroxanthea TaxID=2259622 RepID=A0A8E4DU50_9XANT|nr:MULTISPECIES: DUF1833 family protein [Xanthomonas]SYZ52277.1 hypothetical protein CPBF367_10810 [Xanthomonas arboricola pv. juglandis]MCC4618251.1 DUF1833 domain-containing protein [Xanthomonas campestris pv. asclepiadis]MCC8671566.1 DUF1833 domain-containing protein [Xanthomonas arboricola]NIJ91871.1 hypothetical protein [Xanthomonas euroxanthea]PPT33371.1 hypothetical protein XaCFBP7622_01495 [Xanthomonas arboricola]
MSTFQERRQRVTDTDGPLELLEMTAPSFAAVLRIVNDTQDWTSNGNLYIRCPFRFTPPADQAGQTPRAQLEVDNVGRGITEDLERVQPNELVMCRYLITDRTAPNVIARRFYLPLTQVRAGGPLITAQIGVDFFMRQQAVKLRGNPHTLPGIH